MTVQKTRRTTNTKNIKYIVKLTVKNGLFKNEQSAQTAVRSMKRKNKNIEVTQPIKSGKGYMFKSSLYYSARTMPGKNALINALRKEREKRGIPASVVSITSRKVN